MSATQKTETKAQHVAITPYWSWKDDDYIAQGKFSWLALGEIFTAMAFYYWLASISPWPWVMVISFMAAPILLLRSEKSIKEGARLLKEFLSEKQRNHGRILLYSIAFGCLLLAIYIPLLKFKIVPASFFSGMVFGSLSVYAPLILWSTFKFQGMPNAFDGQVELPTSKGIAAIAAVFEFPHLLGLYLRACIIRIWASIKYLRFGLASFSQNYREAMIVVDMRHSPALLPQAGKVDSRFVLAELLKLPSANIYDQIYKSILTITLYLPALVYRWNIKASALIWTPIALGMSPTKWKNYTELREQSSLSTDKWLFATSAAFLATFVAILAIPHLPNDLVEVLPKWMESKTVISFRPQPNTVRYFLLCLFSLSFAVQLFLALRMRTQHDKPLSSAADFVPYLKDELKDDLESFTKKAHQLRRILKINTALAIFTVWAFTLKFAVDKWPNELHNVVWEWLKPWL